MGRMGAGSRSEVRSFRDIEPRTSNFGSRFSRVSRASRVAIHEPPYHAGALSPDPPLLSALLTAPNNCS